MLKTRGLRKAYGDFQVLRGLDLTVRKGNIYGFLGRNGAGKTTAIQVLMGILKPNSGQIELFGDHVNRPGIKHKKRIGYVSQEQFFYPWMSCRYLGAFVSRFYPTWDDKWFAHLLRVFDLPPNRKVVNLSQGMRVKLALALALAHRPTLLILDEPTSGLDPAARREFLELVSHQAVTEQRTTFFSSHIVEEVERIANRIGILESGRICFEGDLEALRHSVRQITIAEPDTEPDEVAHIRFYRDLEKDGFQLLAHQPGNPVYILRGSSRAWASWSERYPTEWLSLEDIFLALTVDRFSSS